MDYKTLYTVRNIVTCNDVLFTVSKNEVIKFLKDKDVTQFSVDILDYKPVQHRVDAATFITESVNHL